MDAIEFAAYAARQAGLTFFDDEELPEPVGPHDNDTCPDPLDPDEPTHTWVLRSYEPRQHCSCGTLRYPDPERPCRHQP